MNKEKTEKLLFDIYTQLESIEQNSNLAQREVDYADKDLSDFIETIKRYLEIFRENCDEIEITLEELESE